MTTTPELWIVWVHGPEGDDGPFERYGQPMTLAEAELAKHELQCMGNYVRLRRVGAKLDKR